MFFLTIKGFVMKFFKYYLIIITLALLTFNSCNEDTTTVDTADNNSKYVIADDAVITGTLYYKKYDFNSDSYTMTNWDKGAGEIAALLNSSNKVGTGSVDADGKFSLTLNGKMLKSDLESFIDIYGGLSWTPQSFLCMSIPANIVFYPSGSSAAALLSFGIMKPDNSDIETYFGFIYSDQTASITGTATSGTEFNLQYKKGWNIKKWYIDSQNVMHYSTVNSLPNNVIWY
jgi:hypothetical protein